MQFKTRPVSVKAVDAEEGTFEAIVSVFGNKDSYGDIVQPGAFADTLAEWEKSGNPIPVYWSHRMDDPDFNIGHVLEAKETADGLWVKAQIDTTGGKGAQVYRLLKGRRVTQFSFAYDVVDGGYEKAEDEDEFYALRKLKLYEVGPTPIGANQETELLAVKTAVDLIDGVARSIAADRKAGRVLSAKNETELRKAHEAIGNVLSALGSTEEEDQEKASGHTEAKSASSDEEPSGAKSSAADEEPRVNPSAKNLAHLSLLALTE